MKNQPASYEYLYYSGTLPYQVSDPDPMEAVIETVCREFNVPPAEVLGKSREQDIVECRMVCMLFLKKAGNAFKKVGNKFGVTHNAVYSGILRLHDYMKTSPTLRHRVDILQQAV